MAWGRIDDTWWRHRKTLALRGEHRGEAALLFWSAISWSNDQLADGFVTSGVVRMLGSDQAVVDELVRVGFWDAAGDGAWRIHDYLEYNRSREQILADRAGATARQAKRRGSRPHTSQRDATRDVQRDVQRDGERDVQRESEPVSLARPESRLPYPSPVPGSELPSPVDSPPPPAQRGRRSDGTNARAFGGNPRAVGENPRSLGTSPRQERDDRKRGPSRLGDLLAEAARRGQVNLALFAGEPEPEAEA